MLHACLTELLSGKHKRFPDGGELALQRLGLDRNVQEATDAVIAEDERLCGGERRGGDETDEKTGREVGHEEDREEGHAAEEVHQVAGCGIRGGIDVATSDGDLKVDQCGENDGEDIVGVHCGEVVGPEPGTDTSIMQLRERGLANTPECEEHADVDGELYEVGKEHVGEWVDTSLGVESLHLETCALHGNDILGSLGLGNSGLEPRRLGLDRF